MCSWHIRLGQHATSLVCRVLVSVRRLTQWEQPILSGLIGLSCVSGSGSPVKIAVGCDADFSVVDRKGSFTITEDWLESRCGWSPFTGMELEGRVLGTVVRGHTVMWEGQLANEAVGEPLRFAGAL